MSNEFWSSENKLIKKLFKNRSNKTETGSQKGSFSITPVFTWFKKFQIKVVGFFDNSFFVFQTTVAVILGILGTLLFFITCKTAITQFSSFYSGEYLP